MDFENYRNSAGGVGRTLSCTLKTGHCLVLLAGPTVYKDP